MKQHWICENAKVGNTDAKTYLMIHKDIDDDTDFHLDDPWLIADTVGNSFPNSKKNKV